MAAPFRGHGVTCLATLATRSAMAIRTTQGAGVEGGVPVHSEKVEAASVDGACKLFPQLQRLDTDVVEIQTRVDSDHHKRNAVLQRSHHLSHVRAS
eukprot:6200409-Pleurochrysis_carterae.AAC.2